MSKKVLFLIILYSSFFTYSQELVNAIPIHFEKKSFVLPTVNDETKQTALNVFHENEVVSYLLNDTMKVIDSIKSTKEAKKFNQILASILENDRIRFFLSAKNNSEIVCQTLDYKTKKSTSTLFNLTFKDEILLETFTSKNAFYIVSLPKKSNLLKFYCFNELNTLEIKTISFDDIKFYHRSNLYETFEEPYLDFEQSFSLQKIYTDSYVSLEKASKRRKCYINNNKFIITIDTDINFTQIITVDLETYIYENATIKNTENKIFKSTEVSSNSFLNNDKLLQIKASSNKAVFSIKTLNGELLKEYTIEDGEEIVFKNSEITQENGSSENRRYLKNTNQFTRKLNNLFLGVSSYNLNEDNLITIGSVSEIRNNSNVFANGMFGLVGVVAYYALANPTLDNLNAYSNRKVVYMYSLLNSNGSHINKELKEIAFEKINRELENLKKRNLITVFKMNRAFYLCYYNAETNKYNITKYLD